MDIDGVQRDRELVLATEQVKIRIGPRTRVVVLEATHEPRGDGGFVVTFRDVPQEVQNRIERVGGHEVEEAVPVQMYRVPGRIEPAIRMEAHGQLAMVVRIAVLAHHIAGLEGDGARLATDARDDGRLGIAQRAGFKLVVSFDGIVAGQVNLDDAMGEAVSPDAPPQLGGQLWKTREFRFRRRHEQQVMRACEMLADTSKQTVAVTRGV